MSRNLRLEVDGLGRFTPRRGVSQSMPPPHDEDRAAAAVICCKSRAYFQGRLASMGAAPILLTEQFMYPGAFLVQDAIEAWAAGGGVKEIRTAAGKAYAKNQKISVKAATGVFSDLAAVK